MPPKNSQAVNLAKKKMQTLPRSVAACSKEASAYGACVAGWDNLLKHDCQHEFTQFKNCVMKVMKTVK